MAGEALSPVPPEGRRPRQPSTDVSPIARMSTQAAPRGADEAQVRALLDVSWTASTAIPARTRPIRGQADPKTRAQHRPSAGDGDQASRDQRPGSQVTTSATRTAAAGAPETHGGGAPTISARPVSSSTRVWRRRPEHRHQRRRRPRRAPSIFRRRPLADGVECEDRAVQRDDRRCLASAAAVWANSAGRRRGPVAAALATSVAVSEQPDHTGSSTSGRDAVKRTSSSRCRVGDRASRFPVSVSPVLRRRRGTAPRGSAVRLVSETTPAPRGPSAQWAGRRGRPRRPVLPSTSTSWIPSSRLSPSGNDARTPRRVRALRAQVAQVGQRPRTRRRVRDG